MKTVIVLLLCFATVSSRPARAEETATAPVTPLPPAPEAPPLAAPSVVAEWPATASAEPAAPAQAEVPAPAPAPAVVPPAEPMRIVLSPLPAAPEPPTAAATLTAAPAPRRSRAMDWFGIGVRTGFGKIQLAPTSSMLARVNRADPLHVWTADDLALNLSTFTVTPTLHMGGSGYFTKLDLPIGFGPNLTTWGLGFYPINVGVHIESLALFPYLSAGGRVTVLRSKTTDDPKTSHKFFGVTAEARAAAGMKFFPVHGLSLSVEVGYSPWAAGVALFPPGTTQARVLPDGTTQPAGGIGKATDISFGVEWL